MTMAKRTRRTLVYGRYGPKTDERVLFRHVRRIIFNPAQCPPCGVEFCSLILGCAQSLDSTLFFRGISFCSNGAGRVQNLTYAVIGINSDNGRHGTRLSRGLGQAGHDQIETANKLCPSYAAEAAASLLIQFRSQNRNV